MPRKPRQLVTGAYYHVLARGNDRRRLFATDEDRGKYLALVTQYTRQYHVAVVHYCLMTNHVHLLMQPQQDGGDLTHAMHGLQLVYARYLQRTHHQTGHVWEDRFKTLPIETGNYLLECGRYIERNPVRARLVSQPEAYPWSSAPAYLTDTADPLLTLNPEYLALAATSEERQSRYREYLQTPRPYEHIVDRYFDERVLVS